MRVIAGSARGRTLKAPRGHNVRPTADRVKEAMFSSLGDTVDAACVLDLYAGTGALGIEALSRGAAAATFVERDEAVVGVLRRNLEIAGVGDRATVVRAAAAAFAARSQGGTFDLIFCDPPYDEPLQAIIEVLLDFGPAIPDGATIVVERDKRDAALAPDLALPPRLVESRRRSYGDTTVLYLHLDEEATTWP